MKAGNLESSTLDANRASVETAHQKIRPFIHETPVLTSQSVNNIATKAVFPRALYNAVAQDADTSVPRIELFFKCENFQKMGAFKARGAFFNVMSLPESLAEKGVCTHSSGNHAQALALAAKTRGIPAYIVMPTISNPLKIAATKGYGANVTFSGSTAPERQAVLDEVQRKTGAAFIPPYDYIGTIIGQGTAGLELEQQVRQMLNKDGALSPDLDAVIAPLGGGGLLGGTATALSGQIWNGHPSRIYGAEPSQDGADDGKRGLAMNPPTRIQDVKSLTIADGLRTPLGELNWRIISDKTKVTGVFSVTDAQIKDTLRLVLERMKIFVEPSAVVGLAIILHDADFQAEIRHTMQKYGQIIWRIGIILTGGNASLEAFAKYFGE